MLDKRNQARVVLVLFHSLFSDNQKKLFENYVFKGIFMIVECGNKLRNSFKNYFSMHLLLYLVVHQEVEDGNSKFFAITFIFKDNFQKILILLDNSIDSQQANRQISSFQLQFFLELEFSHDVHKLDQKVELMRVYVLVLSVDDFQLKPFFNFPEEAQKRFNQTLVYGP